MLKRMTVVAAAAFVLVGCGGSPQIRVFKGTSTTTQVAGTLTDTVTSTNVAFFVQPGDMPNEWVFLNGRNVYVATASGMALTFMGNQGFMETSTGAMETYTVTLSSGTGTLSNESLSLNLSGTFSFARGGGSPTMGTYNVMFTGARE